MDMMKRILFIIAILLVSPVFCPIAQAGDSKDKSDEVYLFAFFRHGEKTYVQGKEFFSGGAGMYLAWSGDGLKWSEIGKGRLFFKPKKSNTFRDPTLIRGNDGIFRLVWTTGWRDKTIGYAESKDLIHWENQKLVPVMGQEPGARNTWAPEIIYDDNARDYMIFWSSTIDGRFPETVRPEEDGYNHRFYYTTTSDFEKFSPAKLLYDPGFNCIDATILKDGNEYLMFFKNETASPPAKFLVWAKSANATGPYNGVSPQISPKGVWAEGPSAIKINGKFYVYYDMFRENRFGLIVSGDMKSWSDYTGELTMPEGAKHGSFIRITRAELDNLLASVK